MTRYNTQVAMSNLSISRAELAPTRVYLIGLIVVQEDDKSCPVLPAGLCQPKSPALPQVGEHVLMRD